MGTLHGSVGSLRADAGACDRDEQAGPTRAGAGAVQQREVTLVSHEVSASQVALYGFIGWANIRGEVVAIFISGRLQIGITERGACSKVGRCRPG